MTREQIEHELRILQIDLEQYGKAIEFQQAMIQSARDCLNMANNSADMQIAIGTELSERIQRLQARVAALDDSDPADDWKNGSE